MNIAVVGTGYVGLVTGTCFSDMGIGVTCVDIDADKVGKLRKGIIPIYEPGLGEMVARNVAAGRLRFVTDLTEEIDSYDAIFCAVGTPPDEDGTADLRYVLDVARTVGRSITEYTVFVTKSTVPVGTGERVRTVIREELDRRGLQIDFDVVSNPEFLKEGDAVNDFMHPDRVVVGVANARSQQFMERLYEPFGMNAGKMIFTDVASSEMIKYASNAMLATRISFMNEIANLCSQLGADVNMVRKGIGADTRIGDKFLNPGVGYGGSCFPKDVEALVRTAAGVGYDMELLRAVEKVNGRQKRVLFDMFRNHFGGDIVGRRVAIWGLSFKPDTDDMREAPSLVIIDLLLEAGCTVNVYDPIATDEARRRLGDKVSYFDDKYAAAEDADALMQVTEWKEFRTVEWDRLSAVMTHHLLLDGRNIYDRGEVESHGFTYYGIGR